MLKTVFKTTLGIAGSCPYMVAIFYFQAYQAFVKVEDSRKSQVLTGVVLIKHSLGLQNLNKCEMPYYFQKINHELQE